MADAGTIELVAPKVLPASTEVDLPSDHEPQSVYIAESGQEVMTVTCEKPPTLTVARELHKDRDGGRNKPLMVVYEMFGIERDAYLFGPDLGLDGKREMVGPMSPEQAQRRCQACLQEPSELKARQRMAEMNVPAEEDLAGVKNEGLFANHYLSQSARDHSGWDELTEQAKALWDQRRDGLISALGYQCEDLGAEAQLLSTTEGEVQAVAVLMSDQEGFDADSSRFGASPVQYGLAKAHRERVPWVIVLRGTQIRLYSARSDVGVGRRGQAETYFQLDLAVLSDKTVGFLMLIFASGALAEDGSVQEVLGGSERYASELGKRLRERVYEEVMPKLATAVADQIMTGGGGRRHWTSTMHIASRSKFCSASSFRLTPRTRGCSRMDATTASRVNHSLNTQ